MEPVVVTLVCAPADHLWATQVAKLVEYMWLNAFARQIGMGSARRSRLSSVLGSDVPDDDEEPSFGLRSRYKPHWHAGSEVPDLVVTVRAATPEANDAEPGLVLLPSIRNDAVWRSGSTRPLPETVAEKILGDVSSRLARSRPGDPQIANYSGDGCGARSTSCWATRSSSLSGCRERWRPAQGFRHDSGPTLPIVKRTSSRN